MGSFEEAMARGTLWAFATVFGAGILTSLTPCVYPMIPITVSIFGAREGSRKEAFFLATLYVMGIAVMYAGLGVLAAMGGWAAGSLLASPVFVVVLSLLFVVLATSMFGLWEIRLPFWLQNKMSTVGGKGPWGAFAMGMVGGIIIAPCTGPVLAGVLTYVATTGDVLLGASLLFTYAIGIGVLFWVIATFAVALPKSGMWMEAVKSVLGVALVVAALFYLQNVFDVLAHHTPGGWIFKEMSAGAFAGINGGLVLAGVLVGGVHLTIHQGTVARVRKAVGIVLLSAGAFGLVNYALAPSAKLPWIYKEAEALALAKKMQKPVFVDFWAKWCVPCKMMESQLMTDPVVRRQLDKFVLFKVDVTDDTDRDQKLRDKYKAPELPQLILLGKDGKELGRAGKLDSIDQMLEFLNKAL